MPKKSGSSNPAELIKMAIASIDAEIKELTGKRAQLSKMVTGAAASPAARRGRPVKAAAKAKPKRVVSEATRRKLRAAAKARWAKLREEQGG
jgi:hypothetical protein